MADEDKKKDAAAEEKAADKKSEDKAAADKAEDKQTDESSDDTKKEVGVPKKFKGIVEEIEKMSVLDLSELVEILEDKFGVSSAAPVMAAAGPAAGGEAAAEEKSEFDVELTGAGDSKINVIKAIRELTQLGLKEAKDMVDSAPTVIKEGVKKEDAEEMKAKLEEAGGQVTLK